MDATNMLASRVLSRFLPVADGDVSFHDGARRDHARRRDLEAQRDGLNDLDRFHDDEDHPEAFLLDGDRPTPTPTPTDPGPSPEALSPVATHPHPHTRARQATARAVEDDDVPASLLLEPRPQPGVSRLVATKQAARKYAAAEAQWKAAAEHGLSAPRAPRASRPSRGVQRHARAPRVSPEAGAMWLYTNSPNLDKFLLQVYDYYVEHGVWSILLSRLLDSLTQLFVFSFATFLSTCLDYSKIPGGRSMKDVVIPRCMARAGWWQNAALFVFVMYWLYTQLSYIRDVRRLFHMRDFYHHVLGISDQDIQTVSWKRVVDGLVKVQNAHVATAHLPSEQARKYVDYREPQQRLNAESIANRLMRQDNYYVAMYNKDLLDFTLPIPILGTRQFYSKSLEWCFNTVLTNFVFTETGNIRTSCLDVKNRRALVSALRSRLRVAAVCSVVFAPFNVGYNCLIYFFKYYTEFTRSPARASTRSFTPYAEWKIREFNELRHLFDKRLRQAGPFASDYLKQFPKDKMDQLCRFVAFVAGALAAVLALCTLFDPELFLGFEITPGRTAVFYLGVLATIWGMAHGMLPDEHDVHDPVLHLKEVLLYTHYMPAHWKGRLHSDEVRAEFSSMYKLKIMIFTEELLSLIVAPWILWRNSGRNCERVVDFFREQTVHIEGIGHQCNFAYFNFKKDPNAEDPTALLQEPDGLRDDYYGLRDDKMAASVQNFMHYYSHYNQRHGSGRRNPPWQPPPAWPGGIPGVADEPGTMASTTTARGARPASVRRSGHLARHVSPSLIRSPRQAPSQARRRPPNQAIDPGNKHVAESTALPAISESRLMAQDSDLQDFADAPGVPALESDSEAEGDDGKERAGYAGVLGMAAQFAKAQTKATGAGHL